MKLKIERLKKTFGDIEVFKDVSLNIGASDIVALLGSSGSGKSTLLRCINLLEVADSGSMFLDGVEINFSGLKLISSDLERKIRTKIGMVFQQFYLWPHMSVLENLIKAPLSIFKKPKSELIAEAEQLLLKVRLLDKINSFPSQLSGGQQQRVAIARTLMMHPEIILFDEPTSALDPVMTNEVLNIIKQLATEGMSMLIATHEIGFVREVASYIIFLENGKIIEQGSASEILNTPKTAELQNFLQFRSD